jgi:hypothetical protein
MEGKVEKEEKERVVRRDTKVAKERGHVTNIYNYLQMDYFIMAMRRQKKLIILDSYGFPTGKVEECSCRRQTSFTVLIMAKISSFSG